MCRRLRFTAEESQRGMTLFEMLIVLGIIAVIATAAIQTVKPVAHMAVEAASSEIVQAIRFTQNEAVRTGSPRVVVIESGKVLRVYRLVYGTAPPTEDMANPVDHPVSKTIYRVLLDSSDTSKASVGISAAFVFAGKKDVVTHLAFTETGEPVNVNGPSSTNVSKLESGKVTVSSQGIERSILVDPVSGRVTLM